ncbi:MAG: N-acetylmuramoyl-L-alanine amidase [Acidimicrobiia bacterium]|nr:MAG: N-acetylmuramoyl-L-alanine amidase [Acidimicrobiia bacterium]
MRLYHQGDRGEPVRDVQDRLSTLGFDLSGDDSGVFGTSTRQAVADFQAERGIPVDGIVGPETWRSLVDAGYRLGDRMLYHRVPMMRGDDIAELQARLNSLGFDSGKVDGVFGPMTLAGLLDFQRNRELAEDGIAGDLVAGELRLVKLATQKPGREAVREREWLQSLPDSIAGQRVYIDPECRTDDEAGTTWMAVMEASASIQLLGGHPIISRSIDTAPPPTLRAQRANRLNVDIVVGFFVPQDGEEGVFYFSSEHSRSEAGMAIAVAVAGRLGLEATGRTMPMLKNTRSPAIVVSVRAMNRRVGRVVANVIASLYEEPALSHVDGSNR